jgi:DNA-binding transcriptional MerR regulator
MQEMKNEFTTKEVAKVLGATPQLVEDWIARGLITPDLQEGAGAGSKRLFSRYGLYRAALAYSLKKDYKMPRQSIMQIMAACQGGFDWKNSTLKIMANIGGSPDQPNAINYLLGQDPTEKHDIETFIDLSRIVLWVSNRILEVIL